MTEWNRAWSGSQGQSILIPRQMYFTIISFVHIFTMHQSFDFLIQVAISYIK